MTQLSVTSGILLTMEQLCFMLSKDKIETLSEVVLLKMLILLPFLIMFVLDVFHCTPQLNSGKQ